MKKLIYVQEQLGPHKYKTPQGYLICTDAVLARTGKQTYKKGDFFPDCADADIDYDVDRPKEEVFSKDAIASFENMPLTIDHPEQEVTVDNYKDLSVGYVRDVRQGTYDGNDVLYGTLVITDQNAIDKVLSDELKELSCGYDCDVNDEANPIQTHIRGNHVALCEKGRAGIAHIQDSVKPTKDSLWKSADIRRLCIMRNYYTRGDVYAYAKLLEGVDNGWSAEKIARDIYEHSAISISVNYDRIFDDVKKVLKGETVDSVKDASNYKIKANDVIRMPGDGDFKVAYTTKEYYDDKEGWYVEFVDWKGRSHRWDQHRYGGQLIKREDYKNMKPYDPLKEDSAKKSTIDVAIKALDALHKLQKAKSIKDGVSPMTYKKLKELGYTEKDWAKWSDEEKVKKSQTQKSGKAEHGKKEEAKTSKTTAKTEALKDKFKSMKDFELQLLAERSTSAEEIKALIEYANTDKNKVYLRHIAMRNKYTPKEILSRYAKEENAGVRSLIAYNPNTPEEALRYIYKESAKDEPLERYQVRSSLAENKNTPDDLLQEMFFGKDRELAGYAGSTLREKGYDVDKMWKERSERLEKETSNESKKEEHKESAKSEEPEDDQEFLSSLSTQIKEANSLSEFEEAEEDIERAYDDEEISEEAYDDLCTKLEETRHDWESEHAYTDDKMKSLLEEYDLPDDCYRFRDGDLYLHHPGNYKKLDEDDQWEIDQRLQELFERILDDNPDADYEDVGEATIISGLPIIE